MCVNHVGSNLRHQQHCEPLPRGATHSSLTSYAAPPTTNAATCHGKLRTHARRAVNGVRSSTQAALRNCCRAFANCVVKAADQHVCSELEPNAAPSRSKSLAREPHSAYVNCGAARGPRRASASATPPYAEQTSRAQPATRQRSRARAHDRHISIMARCKCCVRNLRAVVARAQRCNCERAAVPDAARR